MSRGAEGQPASDKVRATQLYPYWIVTSSLKTKLWFLAAALLTLLALYCFSGAVMNGSLAVDGGTPAELERFHWGAIVFFWSAASLASAALLCLVVGVVRLSRKRGGR